MDDLLTRSWYSLECSQRITVRGLHFDEMQRVSDTLEKVGRKSEKAAQMAVMLETIRCGMTDPVCETVDDVMRFASANKRTAWRAFELIKELTTDE